MSVKAKLTAMADAIRERTGGTDRLSLDAMASGVAQVYSAGEQAFWDAVQDNGQRKNYESAFAYWSMAYLRPKHKVAPTEGRTYMMFQGNAVLKKLEKAHFDLSQCVTSQTANAHYYTFDGCDALEEIEDLGIQPGYYNATWRRCTNLKTIAVIRFQEDTRITNAFHYAPALENITIEGVIGQNGLNFSWSTKLTHDSLMSILNALKDYSGTGTTYTVTLGTSNLAKLTDAEKLIATGKGWTLA